MEGWILKASGKIPIGDAFIIVMTWLETLLNTCLKIAVGTGSVQGVEELQSIFVNDNFAKFTLCDTC